VKSKYAESKGEQSKGGKKGNVWHFQAHALMGITKPESVDIAVLNRTAVIIDCCCVLAIVDIPDAKAARKR